MIIWVLAFLGAVLPAPVAEPYIAATRTIQEILTPPATPPPDPVGWSYALTDDVLPSPTSFALIPLRATVATPVRVEATWDVGAPLQGLSAFAPLVLTVTGAPLPATVLSARPLLSPGAQGTALGVGACCDAPRSVSLGGESGRTSFDLVLAPGETVLVGFAAVGWTSEDDARLLVTSLSPLEPSAARTGTRVAAVDLLAQADAAGGATIAGPARLGAPADARAGWTPEGTGLLLLTYGVEGAASMRLVATAAGAPILDERPDAPSDTLTYLGEGPMEIEVLAPRRHSDGRLHATAMFIDVPHEGSFRWG